jgi:hypothetical protein
MGEEPIYFTAAKLPPIVMPDLFRHPEKSEGL